MRFKRGDILQGNRNREELTESPTSFPMIAGSPQDRPTRSLDVKHRRMAGGRNGGQRALALLNDPVEKERTDSWMFMLRDFLNKTPPINA